MTTPHDIHELIAAYALGAVSGDERRTVEQAVDADPSLQAELDRHLGTAAALAAGLLEGGEQASDAVWERIADSIGAPRASAAPARRPGFRSRMISIVAAGAVVMTVVLGVAVYRQRSEIDDFRADPLAVALDEARREGADEIVLTGDVDARIVLAADGIGYLEGSELPPLPEEETYQLWALVDDRVVSAGVFGPDPDTAPFHVGGDVTGFALTVEVAGGVVSSEQDPVAIGLLDG